MLCDRYWAERCRRMVWPKEALIQRLQHVIDRFKGDEGFDQETLQHVVTEETEIVHKNVLHLIEDDHVVGELF
jgi:hypothetical protein